jgi:toxin-antitoxin system PIN domain toxin
MILPDVNVLVYAFLAAEPRHATYRSWLDHALNSGDQIAITDPAALGFVRVVTNARIYSVPATTSDATAFVNAILSAPSTRWLTAGDAAWRRFDAIVDADRQVRGSLVPDAWLAALALANGCRLATADRGFARFEGLDWFDPGR